MWFDVLKKKHHQQTPNTTAAETTSHGRQQPFREDGLRRSKAKRNKVDRPAQSPGFRCQEADCFFFCRIFSARNLYRRMHSSCERRSHTTGERYFTSQTTPVIAYTQRADQNSTEKLQHNQPTKVLITSIQRLLDACLPCNRRLELPEGHTTLFHNPKVETSIPSVKCWVTVGDGALTSPAFGKSTLMCWFHLNAVKRVPWS